MKRLIQIVISTLIFAVAANIDGTKATVKDFPHQVCILYNKDRICSGALMKSNVVVTAAFCVRSRNYFYLMVRAGSEHCNRGGQEARVRRVILHPDFDNFKYKNNIALVILRKHFEFGDAIQGVSLPETTEAVPTESPGIVSAWLNSACSQDILKYWNLQILSQEECKRIYYSSCDIKEDVLCAADLNDPYNRYAGDIGGPLVANGTLVGLASYTPCSGQLNSASLFTNITYFRDWIEQSLNSTKRRSVELLSLE